MQVNTALAITLSHQQNTHDFADGRKNMNDIFNNYVCSASHMRLGLRFQNVWRELWNIGVILLSTLTSVASDLFNYSLRLDNELSAWPPRGRHGLWTGLKTQMGCLQIIWWN